MAKLELERGTDVLLLETGDALLLELVDVTITVPLATVDGAGLVPTIRVDRIFGAPLATISSEGLVPAWALHPEISVPLATIDSEGIVPTMVLDRIFAAPLATVDGAGIVPTIRVDRIFSVPLATIETIGLVPVLSLGVTLLPPLATISSEALVPTMVLDRIFATPLATVDVVGSTTTATETLRPNAAGDETTLQVQFPDSTSHYDKVDEAVADDDTTYVKAANYIGGWFRDLYNLPASSGSGTINKITVHFRCKTDQIALGKAKASIKSGLTVADGDEKTHAVVNTWEDFTQEWALNPDDGEAWEWADIDALQIGVYLYSKGYFDTQTWCTQVYVEVNYTVGATLVLDRIFSAPMATMDADALIPALALDMIPIVPLATISAEGLAPTLFLEFFRGLVDFDGKTLKAFAGGALGAADGRNIADTTNRDLSEVEHRDLSDEEETRDLE